MTSNNTELRDFTESKLSILSESTDGDKPMVVGGRFQHCDIKNGNGRSYPKSLWERVLTDDGVMNMINQRRMLGTVEHPASGETALSDVSHIVTKLEMRGDEIYGEAELLNTPQGLIMQELARKGVPVGVSSRGKGRAVYENGTEVVDADSFILETFDLVCKPSTPGAYTSVCESVMSESPLSESASQESRERFLADVVSKVNDLRENTTFASLDSLTDAQRELITMGESIKMLDGKLDIEAAQKDVTKFLGMVNTAIEQKQESMAENKRLHEAAKEADITGLRALVNKAVNKSEMLEERLAEAKDQELDFESITRRCDAATTLASETLGKLKEALSLLAELRQDHDQLQERYEAAVELAARLNEQVKDNSTPVQEVNENQYPELVDFRTLRSAEENLDDCTESVQQDTQSRGFDASVLSFSGAAPASTEDANEIITESQISGGLDDRRAPASEILEEASVTNSPELAILNDLLESTGGK